VFGASYSVSLAFSPAKDSGNALLIIKMSAHKRAAEGYIAVIKTLYAKEPVVLNEAFDRYLKASSEFNSFMDTFGLYLVDKPQEAGSQVFKDLANKTDADAKEFEAYARGLIKSALPKATPARTQGLFGPVGDLPEVTIKIYKVVMEIVSATKKQEREQRLQFVTSMKQQTIWLDWAKITPISQN
jgi:hypothetical protein